MAQAMANAQDMLPKGKDAAIQNKKKPQTVKDYLESDSFRVTLAEAMPDVTKADRFVRSAITEFRMNKALQECSIPSVLGYFLQSAALGLEPASTLGQCYPVPFRNNKVGGNECQFILGYRGMLSIARRSGEVLSVDAHIVYEHDEFELTYGLDQTLKHIPMISGDRGDIIGAYVVVRFRDGSYQYRFMPKSEIDATRKRSKAGNYGPWKTDYEEMAKKTVFRKLFKWLPISIEDQQKASADDAVVRYDSSKEDLEDALEVDFTIATPDDDTDTAEEEASA